MMATAARRTNWFAIWVSVAVVVVIALVAGLVIWMNVSANDPGQPPQAANIDAETGAIAVGDGADTVDTFIDFMCPVCGAFEQSYGSTLAGFVDDGTATLNIHPIAILDARSQGTQFSTRAANAMYCVAVADPDASLPFLQAMFAQQPEEGTSGLSDDELLGIASGAGVTGIDACVNDGTYAKYVTSMTAKTPVQPSQQGISTPTIVVNGTVLDNSQLPAPDQFATLFG